MIHVGDNSWNLRIFITDLSLERQMRVRGDQHLGAIMLQLVDPENPKDWSDHALWWPARNIWLTRTRLTLDQYGVQADSLLHFTPMHKILRVQLPDLRYLDCRVDYSLKTFGAVVNLCKQLDIRYPEELSLSKPLEADHLKRNFAQEHQQQKRGVNVEPAADTNSFVPIIAASDHQHQHHGGVADGGSSGSLDKPSSPGMFFCAPLSPHEQRSQRQRQRSPLTSSSPSPGTWQPSNLGYATYDSSSSSLGDFQENLACSPATPSREVRERLLRPKSLEEKARLNVGWLDSSLSLMEQGIREYDTLLLRFKYFTFFDLNPKYDQVRINQLYEQAKWSILNEQLDCTEEESLMFAALQYQVNHYHHIDTIDSGIEETSSQENDDDEIDSALKELEITLEGSDHLRKTANITHIPELADYLLYLKPQRFTWRGFKRYYFTYKDLHLLLYKNAEESRLNRGNPSLKINLLGCEIKTEVNQAQHKYAIRLEVDPEQGNNKSNSELWIKCDNDLQYAKWLAACRLASKGRSLADSSYESEIDQILSLLQIQKPLPGIPVDIDPISVDPLDYLSPKMLRKLSNKSVQRILEAQANVRELTAIESKMKYIQAWQSLPDFGVTLFIIKFDGHRREELLGVAHNRIMRMDLHSGDHLKTWRYDSMKAWNVNWNIKCMMIQFQNENLVFSCHSADCKVVHEFIGGYIFMSMRSKDNNQTLNDELFHKLTGGWS
ncbi:uncharacterized protein Dwil_GK17582 [Drosophila willistoni]|uniref:PH domain-containing protein n=1 Tax=Drosophila willistoni TaxID=7260 RepID=B4MMV3_DROWI|nr:unc-112-related protein [Drosophila willistoni]XP_046868193.1 unc-112-related protein [Drosophila willistoni]EDW73509.1 uncharacterized protein Dwil_GK17582 [Drosophila willistoni]